MSQRIFSFNPRLRCNRLSFPKVKAAEVAGWKQVEKFMRLCDGLQPGLFCLHRIPGTCQGKGFKLGWLKVRIASRFLEKKKHWRKARILGASRPGDRA